ncbi:MAG: hypothetical protein V5A57_01080 [Candidatus Paceibacterota bacterium]
MNLKKGISTPIVILLIVLVVAIIGVGALFYLTKEKENPEKEEMSVTTIPESAFKAELSFNSKSIKLASLSDLEQYESTNDFPEFGSKGNQVVYLKKNDEGYTVIRSLKRGNKHYRAESKTYSLVKEPAISPDGKHFSYSATEEEGDWFAVTDGKENKSQRVVRSLTFTPQNEVVYDKGALREEFKKNKERTKEMLKEMKDQLGIDFLGHQLVIGDKKSETYLEIKIPILFSSDGEYFAYRARSIKGGEEVVVTNQKEFPVEGKITSIALSSGGRVAYGVKQSDKSYIVEDGEKKKAYEKGIVKSVTFSPTGNKLAYKVERAVKDSFVVVDGEVDGYYSLIKSPIVFSPSGDRVAYIAGWEDKVLVVGDEEKKIAHNPVKKPVWGPNGNHIAYIAKDGEKWSVVIDGEKGKGYNRIYDLPTFNSSGEYIGFGVLSKDALWWKSRQIESFLSK